MIIWGTFFTTTPNENNLSASSLFFCKVVSKEYNSIINIEPVINHIDEAIASNSTPSSALLNVCFKILAGASIVLPEELKTVIGNDEYFGCRVNLSLYRMKSDEIVRKLKQLPSRIQINEQGFFRDAFRVTSIEREAEYLVQSIEYYSPVQYYTNSSRMMKLCEWRVFKFPSLSLNIANQDTSKLKFVAQYNLERSQFDDDTPTYVFGRTNIEDHGYVSIVNYGTQPGPNVDGYYQMKLLVIEDLKLLKGLPVLARTIRNRETGIETLISYGHTRRLQNNLGIEVNSDMLYDDDTVVILDTNTGVKTYQCGHTQIQGIDLITFDCNQLRQNALKQFIQENIK
ncbi:unnamed protein product [Rotaria socialis]|nr:unnamed protein product [Rotaria socialis]CAF4460473.1 unnamed protein product [Rotaria socialis]CAF4621683.1 unnamed protein product [Rotaria socialis]CAF4877900.1 unnamed protein product [Rotaria socialis]